VRTNRLVSAWLETGAALVISTIGACTDIPTGDDTVLSIEVGALPFPSVVVGDSLRDTTGVAAPLAPVAFNFQGEQVATPPFRFRAVDRGVTVDSVRGFIIGDSVRATPARVAAVLGNLQAFVPVIVTWRPDTVITSQARDTLLYSVTDTTKNKSDPLTVSVRNFFSASADSAVKGWLVSFAILSPSDTAFVRLVNDAFVASHVDTTDASGAAGRRIRMDVSRLSAVNDSVVVIASVKYRGAPVRGSPLRLVLELRPAPP
jgi:hypothetical protein